MDSAPVHNFHFDQQFVWLTSKRFQVPVTNYRYEITLT